MRARCTSGGGDRRVALFTTFRRTQSERVFETYNQKGKTLVGFFEDFRSAIDSYDEEYVEVVPAGLQLYGAGQVLNVGEWFRFQVVIRNRGHLDMKNVVVGIRGTEYADVSRVYGNASPYVELPFGDTDAHGSRQSSAWIFGQAKKHTDGISKDVVRLSADRWDASLHHLLADHAGWGTEPEGTVVIEIEPKVIH